MVEKQTLLPFFSWWANANWIDEAMIPLEQKSTLTLDPLAMWRAGVGFVLDSMASASLIPCKLSWNSAVPVQLW